MFLKDDKITVKQLKGIVKLLKIIGISKCKKSIIIEKITAHYASRRIQRFLRGKWIKDVCPVTLDCIQYPCYCFRPKGSFTLIYYNLFPWVNYMLETGSFCCPKSRIPYSDHFLACVDKYIKSYGVSYRSLVGSKYNHRYYARKKEVENSIIVLERSLDDTSSTIRNLIEIPQIRVYERLNGFFFPTFHTYFKYLVESSESSARIYLERMIGIVQHTVQKSSDPNRAGDVVLQMLYTLHDTYLLPQMDIS